MAQTTLEDVIIEVKKVRQRIDTIEKTLITLMIQLMPEEEPTQDEWDILASVTMWVQYINSIKLDINTLVNGFN
jgi:hypothetical protein